MIYSAFQDLKLSQLGFGAMRLPTLPDGSIDEKQVYEMVDTAIEQGVNYFDTAYPYHGGLSELVMGRALARHPRESFVSGDEIPRPPAQRILRPRRRVRGSAQEMRR